MRLSTDTKAAEEHSKLMAAVNEVERAVLAERERCAKIAELVADHIETLKGDSAEAHRIATLIRSGD